MLLSGSKMKGAEDHVHSNVGERKREMKFHTGIRFQQTNVRESHVLHTGTVAQPHVLHTGTVAQLYCIYYTLAMLPSVWKIEILPVHGLSRWRSEKHWWLGS